MRRRTLAASVFLVAILSIGIGAHLYLAERLVLAPAWPEGVRTALLAAGGAGLALLLVQLFFGRGRLGRAGRAVAWAAYGWLGAAVLLLSATAATDLALWLLGAAAPDTAGFDAAALLRGRAALVAGLTAVAASVGLRQGLAPPALRRVEIHLARWPAALDGFRIAQISDLHLGPLLDRRFAAAVAERVNALAPDLVAVTGDLVDGSVRRVGAEVAPLAALRAR
jgi:hypothetical protein